MIICILKVNGGNKYFLSFYRYLIFKLCILRDNLWCCWIDVNKWRDFVIEMKKKLYLLKKIMIILI